MEGVAIIIPWGASLSADTVEAICRPLFPDKIGAMPIFNADTVEEFNLIVNLYEPGTVIVAHTALENEMGWHHNDYSIRVKTSAFGDLKVLSLPAISDWDWDALVEVLNRLEEIL